MSSGGIEKDMWHEAAVCICCAFLLVEAIPSSGSHYMVWDIAPIEIIEQSIFWSSTSDHWAL